MTPKFFSALLAGMVLATVHDHASATYDAPPAQAPSATSAATTGARAHASAEALAGSSATGGEATSSAAGGTAAGGASSIRTHALGLGWQTANTPNPSAATAQPVGCVSRALFEDAWALQKTDPEKAAALLERTYAHPRALGHEGSSPYHVLSFAFGAGDTRPAIAEGKPVPLPFCQDLPTPVILLPHRPEVSAPPPVAPPPAAPRKRPGTCNKRSRAAS